MARRSAADAEFLRIARARFEQGRKANDKQRQRELDDLRFYADDQWDPEQKSAREGMVATGNLPPVPARPTIVINKVKGSVLQLIAQERQSEMAVEIVAADDFAALQEPIEDTEIELREGLMRRIQRAPETEDAVTWAFKRAAIAGEGNYGVMVRYMPGKTFDREIYVERYYNQSTVTRDPAHEQPDGSDAEWVFVGNDKMPFEQYQMDYPRLANDAPNPVTTTTDDDFRRLGEECPGWFVTEDTKDKKIRHVRVVNYWYTERKARVLVGLNDGTDAWEDELPEDADIAEDEDGEPLKRTVTQKTIRWAKIDGQNVLEETDWEGPDMPIIKVLGEELQPYDDERRVQGVVRSARGAQQGFNALASKWFETIGLASIPNTALDPRQIEGFEKWWQIRTTRALPYLPYTRMVDGQDIGKPEMIQTVPGDLIQALGASIQVFDEFIKDTTNTPSVQLGENTDRHLKSGRAIKLLQDQAQVTASIPLDNLKRSRRYEGQVINNLLYPVYGRKPGRLVRIVTGQGEDQTIRISPPPQPAQGPLLAPPGPPTGPLLGPSVAPPGPTPPLPTSAPQGPPTGLPGPGMMPPGAPPMAPKPKTYRLTKDANFNVVVKVTRAFDSRREEEAHTIGTLLESEPNMMTWFGDLFFKNSDGPGHEEMAERAKVMLDPKIQAMLASKQQGMDVPPAAQAQLASLQGQLHQAQILIAQMKQDLDVDRKANEVKLQVENTKIGWEREKLEKELAAKIEVARISAAKATEDAMREAQEETIALGQQHAHEFAMAEAEHQRKLELAREAQQHQKTIAFQRDANGTLTGGSIGPAGNGKAS